MFSNLLEITDLIGIVAFAIAGVLAAEGKNLDPVGVFVMAFTTAFGGGVVRDTIIHAETYYWVAHPEYVCFTIALAVFAPALKWFKFKALYTTVIWADAIGLAFFSVGGTALALDAGLTNLPAVLIGVCTGVFGGLLRDVFLSRVPMVLTDKQPYASAAFAGCWLYILLLTGTSADAALLSASVFTVALRMICWYMHLSVISYDEPDDPVREGAKRAALFRSKRGPSHHPGRSDIRPGIRRSPVSRPSPDSGESSSSDRHRRRTLLPCRDPAQALRPSGSCPSCARSGRSSPRCRSRRAGKEPSQA